MSGPTDAGVGGRSSAGPPSLVSRVVCGNVVEVHWSDGGCFDLVKYLRNVSHINNKSSSGLLPESFHPLVTVAPWVQRREIGRVRRPALGSGLVMPGVPDVQQHVHGGP